MSTGGPGIYLSSAVFSIYYKALGLMTGNWVGDAGIYAKCRTFPTYLLN